MNPPASFNHPGRRFHNWSIYDAGDKRIDEYRHLFRGLLLDLGCGRRTYEAFFAPLCDRYVGIDWSSTLHGLVADVVADLNKPLPIMSECADTVVSFSVIEHLCRPQEFLAETVRILRPGGSIVLQVPFMWQVHEAPFDFFRYTRHGLEYVFAQAGYTDIVVAATTGFWTMWILKLNYQSIRLIRGPRLLRLMITVVLAPLCCLNQWAARLLDRIWPNSESETAGYFVTARKPC